MLDIRKANTPAVSARPGLARRSQLLRHKKTTRTLRVVCIASVPEAARCRLIRPVDSHTGGRLQDGFQSALRGTLGRAHRYEDDVIVLQRLVLSFCFHDLSKVD